jgi:5'-3' exonuclease
MILVDYSQIFHSNLFVQLGKNADKADLNMVRHMVLNSLRSYRAKFNSKYGDLILCLDGQQNWRKDVFPQYKAHRKTNRDKDDRDWDHIFEIANTINDELIEYFPYPVVRVGRAEADDIIGVLAVEFPQINNEH